MVSTTLTSSKARSSFSLFSHSYKSSRLSLGACETGAQTEQKQEVKERTFSFVRLIGQVYLQATETLRAFSAGTSPDTPLPPLQRLSVSVSEYFKDTAKAGTWAKLSRRAITAQ